MHRDGPFEVAMEKMNPNSAIKIKTPTEIENPGSYMESVRANVRVASGKWFYEAKMNSYGKFHFGWCTKNCKMETANNYALGIGHDMESWGFDTSYPAAFHGSNTVQKSYGQYCNSGDVIGVLLDLEAKSISFYRNGKDMGVAFTGVTPGEGLYPCATIQAGQKCAFNFGKEAYKYPLGNAFPDVRSLHINLTKDQQKKLDNVFDHYKSIGIKLSESGETDDIIKGAGLLQLGQDLGQEDDKDPVLLLVAFKLNARDRKVWEISRPSWISGWAVQGAYDADSMKKKIKSWKEELVKDANTFKLFYFFCFDYLKEDKTILSLDECLLVWEMLGFTHKKWPLMNNWIDYLKDKKTKALTRDTWRLFLSFTQQYPKDLSNYNVDDCWPTLLDEWVDHAKNPKKDQKTSKGKMEDDD